MIETCQACGDGKITRQEEAVNTQYGKVLSRYHLCGNCGGRFVDFEESIFNRDQFSLAKGLNAQGSEQTIV